MRNIIIILAISIYVTLALSCKEDKAREAKIKKLQEIQQMLEANKFEVARIAAIDTLDPEIKTLYLKADDQLGHASHLDIRNREIYSELISLYPENELYKNKFIFYDRKLRK
jgi:hypothetical protein